MSFRPESLCLRSNLQSMTNNQNLNEELFDLLTQEVPTPHPRELGFLDVAGKNTSETVICNVYSYFLDPHTSPEISGIMMEALFDLIEATYPDFEKKKNIDLDDYRIELERATGKGRIDILIASENSKSAIIIEAKIYHVLVNDLNDYWRAIDYPDNQKVGVVLSLYHHSSGQIGHPEFVSITHSEWLKKTVAKGLSHQIPVKDFIYFKDFVNNMNHLTHSNEMTEEVQFYLRNADKINKALGTKEETLKFVVNQMQAVAGNLGVELHGSSANWRNIWNKEQKEEVYYTVLPQRITDSAGIVDVIIEISGSAIEHKEALWHWARDNDRAAKLVRGTHGSWAFQQLLIRTFKVSAEDFEKLADRILEVINNELEPIRNGLKEEIIKLSTVNQNKHSTKIDQ